MVRVLFHDLDVAKGNDKGSSTPQHEVVCAQKFMSVSCWNVSWERLKQSCFWQTFRKSLTSFCRQWSLHLLPLMSNLKSQRTVLWDLEVKLKACVCFILQNENASHVRHLWECLFLNYSKVPRTVWHKGGGGYPLVCSHDRPGNDCSYRNTYWV